ncbi:MAG: LacI family DNA-binding transcriptional regulator [Spirochaetales bacterium]|nr:LacI family DNA-binding transcriptional regulator [Spirochaetales bacterium]
MGKKKLHSINDIARIAGVSKATVSRALNGSPLVNQETKELIVNIAKEHAFLPSSIARNLSLRSSRTIGFVTHAYSKGSCQISDPFSIELMGGAAIGLHEMGYDMLVLHVDPKNTDWAAQYLDSGKVDGFILVTSERKHNHITHLLDMGAPFVAWGYGEGRFNSVRGDDYTGGSMAAELLVSRGCKNIACLCGPVEERDTANRLAGCTDMARNKGITLDTRLILHGTYGEESGRTVMEELLTRDNKIDGVFAFSDLMAIGAMKVLAEKGIRVPEDIAIVGFDDIEVASYVKPALTSISQHIAEGGKLLAKAITGSLHDKAISNVVMPVELIRRESA